MHPPDQSVLWVTCVVHRADTDAIAATGTAARVKLVRLDLPPEFAQSAECRLTDCIAGRRGCSDFGGKPTAGGASSGSGPIASHPVARGGLQPVRSLAALKRLSLKRSDPSCRS